MRVLVTTQPATGHLHPLVPVAQALQQAGHEVAFAAARSYGPVIAALGFRVFPAGLDWLEAEAEEAFPELREMPLPTQALWFLQELFASRLAHPMVRDLLAIGDTWKPDLIVREALEFGGCVAAELRGIPHAAVGVGLYSPPDRHSVIASQMTALREAYGLPPDPDLQMLQRHLFLDFTPPGYPLAEPPLPPTVHSLRFVPFDRSEPGELPAWIDELPDRPTVYATMGTVFNRVPGVFPAILEALREEPVNLIVTIGRNADPEQFGPQPEHIRIERYIPQTLLLPRCDLVITHGGFNTVMAALAHGLPLLALPLSADQPFHAARCAALGVGRQIAHIVPEGCPPGVAFVDVARLSAGEIRDAVRDLLTNPSYRSRAEQLRDAMMALPGLEHAVGLLDRLAPGDERREARGERRFEL